MARGLSDDATKWLEELDGSKLSPPGKDLRVSDNFFNFDEGVMDAMNILDMEKMDNVMEQWRAEAHKKMKVKKEVQEIKLEDMTETIGGTVLSERRNDMVQGSVNIGVIRGRSQTPDPTKATPTVSLPPRALSPNPPSHSYSASVYDLPESAANRQRFTTSPAGLALEIPEITEIPTLSEEPDKAVWRVPTIKETINRILSDQPYVLEWYKSLENKRALLNEAISTHDGNTIITVVLYLRSSLSKSLFEVLLLGHPIAAQHYCSFLRQNSAWDQLKAVYYVLGEQRYAMLQYQLCLTNDNIPSRINALDSCKLLFKDRSTLEKEVIYVEEYRNLLKRQQKIEIVCHRYGQHIVMSKYSLILFDVAVRAAQPASVANRYQGVPILDSTLITSLFYCCRFHLNDQIPDVNPEGFKKDFNIPEKQYFVVLVGSLCTKKDWESIEKLLTPKGWHVKLGLGSKLKSPISLERLIRIIGKRQFHAPEDFLSKYIRLIDDLETRLELATKYECFGVGIEVLKQLKDIERLKAYFNQIPVDKQRKYRPGIVKLFS